MLINAIFQLLLFIGLLVFITKPFGAYIANVFEHKPTFMDPVARPIERFIYRLCGVDPDREHNWWQYMVNIMIFSIMGLILLYFILTLQAYLPFNPQHIASLPPELAFNTAASFVTNTNWQAYAGESTMSYFSQMAGLAVQNFCPQRLVFVWLSC